MVKTTVAPKIDVFWKSAEGGGGAFPIQKITLQILLVSKRHILEKKRNVISKKGGEGGVIANPKKIIANLRILTNFHQRHGNNGLQCASLK